MENITEGNQISAPDSSTLMSAFELEGVSGNPQDGSQGQALDDPMRSSSNIDWNKVGPQFQSRYDQAQAALTEKEKALAQFQAHSQLLNQIVTDKEMRLAFLREIDPELAPQINIDNVVENQLMKEFGEDFNPDAQEATRGYGKSFRYYERAKELYKQAESKGTNGTLTELRQAQIAKQEAEQAELTQQKEQLMQSFGWKEEQLQNFFGWAQKLTPHELAKMYAFAVNKAGGRLPNLPNVNGNAPTGTIDDRINKLFGPPKVY
jgi:hypothetical protein